VAVKGIEVIDDGLMGHQHLWDVKSSVLFIISEDETVYSI